MISLWSKSFSKSNKRANSWPITKGLNNKSMIYKPKNRKTRKSCLRIGLGLAPSRQEHTLAVSNPASSVPLSLEWKKLQVHTCSKTAELGQPRWNPPRRWVVGPKPRQLLSAIQIKDPKLVLFQRHRQCLATTHWQRWQKMIARQALWFLITRWT